MKDKGLQDKSDNWLIKQVKDFASNEAFIEICRRYEQLFYRICHKYASSLSSCGVYIQDIFNEKNIIILHCIKTFNPSKKTKLSSWIGNYARYLCLNSINSKRFVVASIDEDIHNKIEESQIHNDYLENQQNLQNNKEYIVEIIETIKDVRIKEIFNYRYFQDKKMIWNKIAKKMKTSPQTIASLHKKGIFLIKNKIQSDKYITA